MFVDALPIPWPVCGLHNVLVPSTAFWVVVPRPHVKAAQQVHSTITYPSVRARVKVGDTAEDTAHPGEKIDFSTIGI